MQRNRHLSCLRVLLVSIVTVSCGAFPVMIVESAKRHTGAEPFTTFHRLDRQISVLGKQSAALQKTATAPQLDQRGADPPWHSLAGQMGHTATIIDRLTLSLKHRYRKHAFATRLFGRLHKRTVSLKSSLRAVRSADTPDRASAAAATVDKRIVALGLQYNAITAGYAALQCSPGEWTCCEPKRQEKAEKPDACRWVCTKQAHSCRGFVGPRAATDKRAAPRQESAVPK